MGKTQQTLNVCDDQKQITNKHFNSLTNDEKMSYISNGYCLVDKIKPPQQIKYYDYQDSGEDDDTVCFTNSDQFRQAILNNTVILDKVIQHIGNISFDKKDLIIPVKKGSSGRNSEKYPIPTTECEKRFCLLNPEYRCKSINRSNKQCSWIINKNGVCENCNKKGLCNKDISEDFIQKALTTYKTFSKKSNWEDFVSKFYQDNIFQEDFYNSFNSLTNSNSPPTSPVNSPKKAVKKKVVKKAKAKP